MADNIVTAQKLKDADKDCDALDQAVSGGDSEYVKTRRGKEYPTMPNAIRQIMENGGFMPFATEAELLAYVPNISPSAAKAMDTKKVWLWKDNVWHDTGLSELDQAKESAAEIFLPRFLLDNTKHFFALLAAKNQMTDLTIDRSGQFAEFVVDRWRERLNNKNGISFLSNTKYLLAYLDKNNRMTDLTLDRSGQFAEFVVKRLADRISNYLDMNDGLISPKEYIFNGVIKPSRPNITKMSVWGSSSMSAISRHLINIVPDYGITDYYAGAKGGERVQQIAARQGAVPAILTFPKGVIPKSGEVEVNVNWMPVRLMQTYDGIVAGVHGTFRIDYDTLQHYFKRTSDGDEVNVSDSNGYEFIPDAQSYRDSICIINVGKNNFSASTDNSAEFVLGETAKMVGFLSPLFKYVIVMGHFVNTTEDTPPNLTAAQRALDCNAGLAAQYGDLYYDLQAYVTGAEIWSDTGISPTEHDLEQQAKGQKPDSLSADYQHLNAEASRQVALRLVEKLKNLQWVRETI